MSRSARKGQRSSASTWRKRDRHYREAEAARRRANAARRAEVAEAERLGLTIDAYRRQLADDQAGDG